MPTANSNFPIARAHLAGAEIEQLSLSSWSWQHELHGRCERDFRSALEAAVDFLTRFRPNWPDEYVCVRPDPAYSTRWCVALAVYVSKTGRRAHLLKTRIALRDEAVTEAMIRSTCMALPFYDEQAGIFIEPKAVLGPLSKRFEPA